MDGWIYSKKPCPCPKSLDSIFVHLPGLFDATAWAANRKKEEGKRVERGARGEVGNQQADPMFESVNGAGALPCLCSYRQYLCWRTEHIL